MLMVSEWGGFHLRLRRFHLRSETRPSPRARQFLDPVIDWERCFFLECHCQLPDRSGAALRRALGVRDGVGKAVKRGVEVEIVGNALAGSWKA